MYYIYKIQSLIDGKCYIGQTNNFKRRKSRHLSSLKNNKHDNPYLQKAYLKYGEKNFTFEIVEEADCSKEEIDLLEIKYIKKYDSYLNGYNCNEGGSQHNGFVSKFSKEDIFNICSVLEFYGKRCGTLLGNIYETSNTTIYRINHRLSHEDFSDEYRKMPESERRKLYENFCKKHNLLNKIYETQALNLIRVVTEEQAYIIYIYQEFGNGKRTFISADFGIQNCNVLMGIRNRIIYKDYYEKYKTLTLDEKIEKLCHYMETYKRKPPELLENLIKNKTISSQAALQ